MNSSLFLVVRTPVLLADFVRRADRRGTSERTSGGKAVTGARGSILHPPFSVKSIFELFLGWHPCFVGFTPEFRLFSRTGRNRRKSKPNSPTEPGATCLYLRRATVLGIVRMGATVLRPAWQVHRILPPAVHYP